MQTGGSRGRRADIKQIQEPGKRIVSKGKYAINLGEKFAVSSFGVAMLLLGCVGTVCACGLLLSVLMNLDTKEALLPAVLGVLIMGMGAATFFYVGGKAVKKAEELDTGVPLTRANTADLLAPDSLVRASSEPVQAQEAVLLRASVGTQARQEEQLLRASVGGQEGC